MKGVAGMRGIRGLYSAVAAAMGNMAQAVIPQDTIMDRAPGFMGAGPKVHRCLRTYSRNSKKPHQGAKECRRRLLQMSMGTLRYSNCGGLTPHQPFAIFRVKKVEGKLVFPSVF